MLWKTLECLNISIWITGKTTGQKTSLVEERLARINNAPIDKYLIEEAVKALVFLNRNLISSVGEIFSICFPSA